MLKMIEHVHVIVVDTTAKLVACLGSLEETIIRLNAKMVVLDSIASLVRMDYCFCTVATSFSLSLCHFTTSMQQCSHQVVHRKLCSSAVKLWFDRCVAHLIT